MRKKKEIIMDLLRELERTIITIMNVLNVPDMEPEKSEGKWIPVELFHPEPHQHVLVTYTDGSVGENWITEVMYLSNRGVKTNDYGWNDCEDEDILAWMPMPSAWEGWKQP